MLKQHPVDTLYLIGHSLGGGEVGYLEPVLKQLLQENKLDTKRGGGDRHHDRGDRGLAAAQATAARRTNRKVVGKCRNPMLHSTHECPYLRRASPCES